jgi:hypothetical protein
MSDKTPLQLAMQAAYETAFGESTIPLNVGGIDFPTRPDNLTDRQLCAFLRYGKRGANDAYNSEAKKLRDEGSPVPNPKDWFPDWLADFGTNKPRGGARLSIETAGWIEYYKSKHSAVKFKGKTPNGTNIDEYHTAFVKNAIWPSVRNHIATMTQDDQRNWVKSELPNVIAKHKSNVLAKAEADTRTNQPGDFIEIERKKREGTTPNDVFTIEIDLD